MRWPALLIAALTISSPIVAAVPGHLLTPFKRIGVGWRDNLWKEKKWGWMSFVAFSPSGAQIASDGATSPDDVSGDLAVWNFATGKLLKRLPGSPAVISSQWHYYATQHDVRSMKSGAVILPGKGYLVQAFSPNERYVVRSSAGTGTQIFDLQSRHLVRTLGTHSAFALTFSPNGRRIAAGYWDSVGLWDSRTGVLTTMLRGVGRYVDGVSYSPSGKLLAVGTDLGGLQLWDVNRHKRIYSVSLPGGAVSVPAFSSNGRLVAIGVYGTGAVWVIDVHSGKIIDHQQVSDLGCGSAAFSPDDRFLITPSTGGLITWPYDKGGTTRVFRVASTGAR